MSPHEFDEGVGKVIAGTAVEPHPLAVLAGNNAEAVMLDLVQPIAARRQFVGFGWEARRDEPGREGTLQHADQIRFKNGSSQLTGDGLAAIQDFTLATGNGIV